jgi:glycosyltransferase involved in cell wall biosynthesis
MTASRILSIRIYGINYAPEETGIAPYTTGLAEHLAASGHRVTVATGMPHYPAWHVPDGHRHTRTERIGSIDVHRRRHYVPNRPSALKRGFYELSFYGNGLLARGLPDADLAIGVTPSLSGALLAASWAKHRNRPYGLIVQDLMGLAAAQSGTPGGSRVADAAARLEAIAVRRAAAIGVIADGFRPHLHAMGASSHRIHRIRNWTHIQPSTLDSSTARAQLGLPQDAFIALHAGNMGLKQGLENVVTAAKLAARQPDPIQFVFIGDGNQRHILEQLAAGLPNVRFIPPLPAADFPNALAAADVLLVNQRPTITDMCLPSKLTSYFAAQRPVVAAVAPDSETARELTTAHAGLAVSYGEPEQLLTALETLRRSPQLQQELAERGAAYATDQLTPAASFAAIDGFVDAILTGTRTAQPVTFESLKTEGIV